MGLGVNYLHQFSGIVPKAAISMAKQFSRLTGGCFREAETQSVSGEVHRLMSEFSDVMKCHAEARSEESENSDGFTAEGAMKSLEQVQELIAQLDAYKRHFEGWLK